MGAASRVNKGLRADSIARRIADRDFPSVFQAWHPADNLKDEDPLVTLARHDLVFHGPEFFGLQWERDAEGAPTRLNPDGIARAMAMRRRLLRLNPKMILLAEIRYLNAWKGFLPEGHGWWKYENGELVWDSKEAGLIRLDWQNRDFQHHVAAQCKAVVESGVVDGIMLDCWQDDEDRLALIKAVRAAVGEKALVIANVNDIVRPLTSPYLNGYFMECYRSHTPEDWQRIADTLSWAEKHLRKPTVNCLEVWSHESRQELNLMRATTTLALCLSNGYCLFADNGFLPTPDHLHDWYPFWNKGLGKATAPGRKRRDKAFSREFEKGAAVYNPMGNEAVAVVFPEERTSLATGKRAREHALEAADGDIYLK